MKIRQIINFWQIRERVISQQLTLFILDRYTRVHFLPRI